MIIFIGQERVCYDTFFFLITKIKSMKFYILFISFNEIRYEIEKKKKSIKTQVPENPDQAILISLLIQQLRPKLA